VAFAGVLLQPVTTREAGYELLDRYLRCLDVDPQSSDLLYRINRRVPSRTGLAELQLNRLTTWSVGRFGVVVGTQLLGEAGQPGAGQVERVDRYACVLELDINTVPEPRDRTLPSEGLSAIFNELLELGTEIAARGDQST
jgi:hypothetical protein